MVMVMLSLSLSMRETCDFFFLLFPTDTAADDDNVASVVTCEAVTAAAAAPLDQNWQELFRVAIGLETTVAADLTEEPDENDDCRCRSGC